MASLTTHQHSHHHNSLTSLFRSTDYQSIEKGIAVVKNHDEQQLFRSPEALLLQRFMQSGAGDRCLSDSSSSSSSSSMCNKRGNLDHINNNMINDTNDNNDTNNHHHHHHNEDHAIEAPDFKSASSAAAVAELLKTGTLFKSSDSIATFKDNDNNAFKSVDISGVFKSQDSLINKLFKGATAGSAAPPVETTTPSSFGKTTEGSIMLPNHNNIPDQFLSNASGTNFKCSASIFASRDWIPQFEPSHVDVDPKEVFQSEDGNGNNITIGSSRPCAGPAKLPVSSSSASSSPDQRKRTDWEAMYESSLPSSVSPAVPNQYLTTTTTTTQPYVFPDVKSSSQERYPSRVRKSANTNSTMPPYLSSSSVVPNAAVAESLSSSLSAAKQQPAVSSREKSANKNHNNKNSSISSSSNSNSNRKEPAVKVYYEPQDADVLLGRGGRTNHHPGNKRYLEAKDLIQDRYLAASKNEKTDISQELVDVVHAWGGRFLQLDEIANKWFEVTNIKARKKASQTLREMNTPEQRAAKRAKYGK